MSDNNDRGRGPDFGESTTVQPQDIEKMLIELSRFIEKHKKRGRDPITIAAALTNSLNILWEMVPPATQLNMVANLTGFLGALSHRLQEEQGLHDRTLRIGTMRES